MKNTKKLFLSVFALSAMILSACSGGTVTPDTSSTEPAPGTSSQEPAPATSSQEPGPASSSQEPAPASSSTLPPEESSSSGEESSSVEPVISADYRVEIGNAVYDLVYNTDQTEYTEYYLGADVTKAVSAGEAISFLEYDWDHEEYDELTATPSPDDTTGLVYNNVVLDGTDYEIRASGDVAIYLKQDLDGNWTYWITGGGDMEDPFYTTYRLAYGANAQAETWQYGNALVGVKAESGDAHVLKQLKFTLEVTEQVGAKVWDGGTGWYGEKYAQEEYQTEEEDGDLVLPAGKYEIYFKQMDEGDPQIWVAKGKPSTIEHMYLFYGETQLELTRRVEPNEGWNQFYAEELQISKDTPLLGLSLVDHLPTSSAEFPDVNQPSAEVMALLKEVGSQTQFKYDGKYSVYLNEKDGQKFDLYLVREGGIPTVDTKFTLKTDGPVPANNDIYVAGTMNATAWSLEDAFKLTPNEGRDTWTATFKLSDGLEYDYKFVLKPADGNADWDTLNPGYSGEGNNRKATGGLAVNVDLNVVPAEGWYIKGSMNKWAAADGYALALKNDDLPDTAKNQYYISLQLNKDDEFKFNLGSEWVGFDKLEEVDAKANFEKNNEEGSANNNIIVKEAGTYEFYLKELTAGGYSIFVKKVEAKPSTIEHIYLSVDGTIKELARGVEQSEGWNQFVLKDVDLTTSSVIGFYKDAEGKITFDPSTEFDEPNDVALKVLEPALDGKSFGINLGGKYSFYINEETKGKITIHMVRDGGMPIEDPVNISFDFGSFIGEGELPYAWVFNSKNPSSTAHWEKIEGGKLVLEKGEYDRMVICAVSKAPDDVNKWDDNSHVLKQSDGDIIIVGVDETLTYVTSDGNRALFSKFGAPSDDGLYVVINGGSGSTIAKATVSEGDATQVEALGLEVNKGDIIKILERKTENEVTSYYYYSKGLDGECEGFEFANKLLKSVTAEGYYDFYIKNINVDGKLYWIGHSPIVYSATINDVNVENLEEHAIAKGENVWVYKFNLETTDTIAFFADGEPMDFVHWDSTQEKAIVDGHTFKPEVAGRYDFSYKLGEGIYLENVVLYNVKFTVDMQYEVGVTSVKLAGNFTNWATNAIAMTDEDHDNVYEATVELPKDFEAEFKFIKNESGWESMANNRSLTVTEAATKAYTFNDVDFSDKFAVRFNVTLDEGSSESINGMSLMTESSKIWTGEQAWKMNFEKVGDVYTCLMVSDSVAFNFCVKGYDEFKFVMGADSSYHAFTVSGLTQGSLATINLHAQVTALESAACTPGLHTETGCTVAVAA